MIYYKATDMNGRDFRTGTVQFTVGESVPPLPEVNSPRCCTSDVYHASVAPESTLIGGLWPCRLFEVEGTPVAEEGQKRGFYTFKVVREIEAWRALGPNGREVAAFIERCKTLSVDEVSALTAPAWNAAQDAVWGATRGAAWDAAWDATRDATRGAAWDAAWNAAQDAVWGATRGATRGAAWNAAQGAAWGAAALCVRDLISEEHLDILCAPAAALMTPRGDV